MNHRRHFPLRSTFREESRRPSCRPWLKIPMTDRKLPVIWRDCFCKFTRYFRNQPIPITFTLLPKQAHRWIPRTVFTISHPTPVGVERQQRPRLLTECAGKMRRHRVNRDDEIERAHHPRIVERVVATGNNSERSVPTRTMRVALQNVPLNTRNIHEQLNSLEWD